LFHAKQIKNNLFSFHQGEIVVTGMGPIAAHMAAKRIGCDSCWINIGCAGTMQAIPQGAMTTIGSVSGLCWRRSSGTFVATKNAICLQVNNLSTLYTVSRPVHEKIGGLEASNFIDMEGYAIAQVAAARNVPLMIIKVISDHCNRDSSLQIVQSLPEISYRIAERVQQIMEEEVVPSVPTVVARPPATMRHFVLSSSDCLSLV
jgi:hypothetical protein